MPKIDLVSGSRERPHPVGRVWESGLFISGSLEVEGKLKTSRGLAERPGCDLWANWSLSWERGEFHRALTPPDPSRRAGLNLSLCCWPPMPVATQAAGVRCICLIIIRRDGGVLEMKEANHRAPLSKVCLPDWGVLDLSPLPPPPLLWHPSPTLLFLKSCLH